MLSFHCLASELSSYTHQSISVRLLSFAFENRKREDQIILLPTHILRPQRPTAMEENQPKQTV